MIAIIGNVEPTDLLAASSVKIINTEPIKTSTEPGLPTILASSLDGSSGRYKADATAKNAKR
jgi:hypothetical protein